MTPGGEGRPSSLPSERRPIGALVGGAHGFELRVFILFIF